MARQFVRHPAVWAVLYLPRSATAGFVTLALTYRASAAGISVTKAAFLTASVLLTSWLKWIWAPIVDVTLSPKRWYAVGLATCVVGIVAMSALPLTASTLPMLLVVVGIVGLASQFLPMSLEAMLVATTAPEDRSRSSAWFQLGNLVGASIGGGAGLTLLENVEEPWMIGVLFAVAFAATSLAIRAVPHVARNPGTPREAMRSVFRDLRNLAKTKGGLLATVLAFLPITTGAALSMLGQARVAAVWGATAGDVALVQGYAGSFVIAVGCLFAGRLGTRWRPRPLYIVISLAFSAVALAMAVAPHTRTAYIAWSLAYQLVYGMGFTGFMLFVLAAIGSGTIATKYSIYASLGNFPIWWLGLALGRIADDADPFVALAAEAGIGFVSVALFVAVSRWIGRTSLPDELL